MAKTENIFGELGGDCTEVTETISYSGSGVFRPLSTTNTFKAVKSITGGDGNYWYGIVDNNIVYAVTTDPNPIGSTTDPSGIGYGSRTTTLTIVGYV